MATVTTNEEFGTHDGTAVMSVTLGNANGVSATFMSYGATLMSVKTPSSSSKEPEEVTLNMDSFEGFLEKARYYGSTVGRVCNRIAKGKFVLEGKEYSLAINNGVNALHGGLVGFDKRVWAVETYSTADPAVAGVKFTLEAKDGEEGYPGNMTVTADYALTANNSLQCTFSATSDKTTIVNLTNHTYWNLSGNLATDIKGHVVTVQAEHYLPVDETQIPTGELAPVSGTAFDLRSPTKLQDRLSKIDGGGEPGFDHCFVVSGAKAEGAASGDESKSESGFGALPVVATVTDPKSGRSVTVTTSQPGMQLYTGNFLAHSPPHAQHWALCLETQNFPDAINKPDFPSAVLKAGDTYCQRTAYTFAW